ncbi:MAG: protease modulator HflK [Gemmataceae bacterium]
MKPRYWLLGTLVLLLIVYLLSGITQIQPGERGVVRRLGRVVATPGPGLWIGFPWGIDRVDRIPVNLVRRVTVGYQPEADNIYGMTPAGQLLTGDHNLVNVQVVIHYAVREDEVENFLVQGDQADGLVARAAESVLTEWVARRTIDDVIITSKGGLENWLVARTQERIEPYQLGIDVQAASVAHLLPPDEVKSAFDEVTREQTAILTREHQAQQEADRIRRDAQADRFRLQQETAVYVNNKLKLAQVDVDTFANRLSQYQRLKQDNPDFLNALWRQEMGKLLARLKETGRLDLLDNHLGPDGLDITHFAEVGRKK